MRYAAACVLMVFAGQCLSLAAEAKGDADRPTKELPRVDSPYAGKPAAPPPAMEVKTRKPEDRVEMKTEGDAATWDVFSPSGIGGATITAAGGKWPATVTVRLRLRGLESLAISNGKVKLAGSVLSHSGNARRVSLTEDGKEQPGPAETEIRVLDAAGKPIQGLPDQGGCFEITLPKALLEGQPKSLELNWIDFYRG
jgi:hypothetical protein